VAGATHSPHKRSKIKVVPPSKPSTMLPGGLITNQNLQKIVNFDPSQYRGVTDGAGGVFGKVKREVTEFDLRLVYKH